MTIFFPVAPGITTLPTTPVAVDGIVTVPVVVPVWNEKLLLDARTRTICSVVGLPYALQLTTPLMLATKTKATVVPVLYINAPAASVVLAPLAPVESTSASMVVPVAAVGVAAAALVVQPARIVEVPVAVVSVAGVAPDLIGRQRIQVAGLAPGVAAGASVAVPAAGVTVAGVVPSVVMAASDPNFSNVSLLLHMDGSNGSTTFTDSSSSEFAISVFGDAEITTSGPKFGTGALVLSAPSDYLATPSNSAFTFSTGDFTIELWSYFESIGESDQILIILSPTFEIGLAVLENQLTLVVNSTLYSLASLAIGSWQHIAVSRSGTNLRVFIDGEQIGLTITDSTDFLDAQFFIGDFTQSGSFATPYKIDDLRITKGVARYTANFTPSTSPFPDA